MLDITLIGLVCQVGLECSFSLCVCHCVGPHHCVSVLDHMNCCSHGIEIRRVMPT